MNNRSMGQNQGNQMSPGRATGRPRGGQAYGEPDINAAIGGGMPAGNAVFEGARQTIGARDSQPGQPAYTPPNGNTGVTGGMGDPMGQRNFHVEPQPSAMPEQGVPVKRFNGASPEDFMRQSLEGIDYGPEGLGKLTDMFKQHGLIVNTALDGGVRGRVTDAQTGDFWDVLDPKESMHWWTNKTGEKWNVGNRQAKAQEGPTFGRPIPQFGQPNLMNAITQQLPGLQQGENSEAYSTRLREQIMKAITNPQLAALLGQY